MGFDHSRPDAYGEAFAEVYDRWYDGVTDAEATARFVADRAGEGPVLELGVGTGRLAAPMVALGLTVIGVDASTAMLAHCVADRSCDGLHLVQADMAHLPLTAGIGTALIAFNTLFNLPSARLQQATFYSLADALVDDGLLILEAIDLSPLASASGQSAGLRDSEGGVVTVIGTGIEPGSQLIHGQHTQIDDDGILIRPWLLRWATPSQIDDYADSAGFDLLERVADWQGTRFHHGDDHHVSVYRRRRRPRRR